MISYWNYFDFIFLYKCIIFYNVLCHIFFIINLTIEWHVVIFHFQQLWLEWQWTGLSQCLWSRTQVHWVYVKEGYSWVRWQIYFYLFDCPLQDFQSGWTSLLSHQSWMRIPFPHIFSSTCCSSDDCFLSVWGKIKAWCCFDFFPLITILRYFFFF